MTMNSARSSLPIVVMCACAALLLVLASAQDAHADSDDLATLGVSSRVAWQSPSASAPGAGSNDYTTHLGVRGELLYILGAELEYSPGIQDFSGDIYRPSLRLTGHVHLVNSRYFDFYLGAGLASADFGDLVDLEGRSTLYRVGAGTEIIFGGHWAVGLDGYWNVAGLGYFNERLSASLKADEGFPDVEEQVDPSQLEIGLALRYYL